MHIGAIYDKKYNNVKEYWSKLEHEVMDSSLVLKFVFFLAEHKSEIRISKLETISNDKNAKFKTKRNSIIMMPVQCFLSATTQRQGAPIVSNIWTFDIRICFGFRISCFVFLVYPG